MTRGVSILELLVALALLSALFTAVVIISFQLPRVVTDGAVEQRAFLQEESIVAPAITALFTGTGRIVSGNQYLLADHVTIRMSPSTYWSDSIPHSHIHSDVVLSGTIDPPMHGICEGFIRGDWNRVSQSRGYLVAGDLLPFAFPNDSYSGSSISATSSSIAVGIASTTSATSSTLFLFTPLTQSATRLTFLSSIDNASTTRFGISALAFGTTFLYVATNQNANYGTCREDPSCAQLQVFSFDAAKGLQLVSSTQLGTTTAPFAIGTNGQATGKSITYADNRLYVGLTKTGSASGDEFNMFDAKNPSRPIWLGGFHVGAGVSNIRIEGEYAYVATDDTSRELLVLNIHDPSHITLVQHFNAPGNSTFGYGNRVVISPANPFAASSVPSNTVAILGRTYVPNNPELISLAFSSTSPSIQSSTLNGSQSHVSSVRDMMLRDFLLFVLSTNDVQIFFADPSYRLAPFVPKIALTQGSAIAFTCYGNSLYVLSNDASMHTAALTSITPQ